MKPITRNRQKGIALMFVLFALLLLTILAGGMMFMSNTDIGVNANYRDSQLAYFAARAGIEEVRQRLKIADPNTLDAANPATSRIPQASPSAGGGVLYVINQATDPVAVTPWVAGSAYMDDELCHGGYVMAGLTATAPNVRCTTVPTGTAWYQLPGGPVSAAAGPVASTGPNAGAASALAYKWVRVTMKENQSVPGYSVDGSAPGSATAHTPVCWNGTAEELLAGAATCQQMANPATPVYLVASLAVSRLGARRMVDTEVAKNMFPPPPSALTLDGAGATPFFGTPHSDSFGINGNDAPGCSAAVKPAIGVTTAADQVGVGADVFRPANYTGAAPPPPATATPSVVNLAPVPAPNPNPLQGMTTVADLQSLVSQIELMVPDPAHMVDMSVVPTPPIPDLGTSAPTVVVIKGNYNGPCSGSGILLVTGTLTCQGATTYNGLIAAIGAGSITFQGGGGGGTVINGAVFEGNLFDATGRPLPGTSLPGIPQFTFNGGGTNSINYNSCDLNLANNYARARTINTREVIY